VPDRVFRLCGALIRSVWAQIVLRWILWRLGRRIGRAKVRAIDRADKAARRAFKRSLLVGSSEDAKREEARVFGRVLRDELANPDRRGPSA
jgi:hypothetical protein